jgi:DNA-binding Lrp family transcriptional regulator
MIKRKISELDRLILKELLLQENRKTSEFLSKKLGIPLTTIQRRRKILEQEIIKMEYFLRLDKFGWRRVDFFLSPQTGKNHEVANEILSMEPIIFVGKTIGQHTIDLKAESIVKDNSQILGLMEKMKTMDGIKEVVWSEIVMTLARKPVPNYVIDQL